MFGAADPFNALWDHCSLAIGIALTSYMMLVQYLRYNRAAEIEAPFANQKRPLSSMTVKEAHAILVQLQELEFPYAFAKARRLALLKVPQSFPDGLSRGSYWTKTKSISYY